MTPYDPYDILSEHLRREAERELEYLRRRQRWNRMAIGVCLAVLALLLLALPFVVTP